MAKRPRTERRAAAREQKKLADARERLARLSEGGTPARPIEVMSASVVESVAIAQGCARCEGEVRLVAHDAVPDGDRVLRRARVACKVCRASREVWLRVVPDRPS